MVQDRRLVAPTAVAPKAVALFLLDFVFDGETELGGCWFEVMIQSMKLWMKVGFPAVQG